MCWLRGWPTQIWNNHRKVVFVYINSIGVHGSLFLHSVSLTEGHDTSGFVVALRPAKRLHHCQVFVLGRTQRWASLPRAGAWCFTVHRRLAYPGFASDRANVGAVLSMRACACGAFRCHRLLSCGSSRRLFWGHRRSGLASSRSSYSVWIRRCRSVELWARAHWTTSCATHQGASSAG